MAIIFKYCDDWKSAILECPRCGWKGTFDRGAVEHYEELMDSSCPNCPWLDAPMLAIVDCAPTIEESEQNWSRLSESERAHVTARKEFLQRLRAAELKSPDQLPEVEGPDLTIVWDHIEDAKHDRMTVLRDDADESWREPAVYEGTRGSERSSISFVTNTVRVYVMSCRRLRLSCTFLATSSRRMTTFRPLERH